MMRVYATLYADYDVLMRHADAAMRHCMIIDAMPRLLVAAAMPY